MGNTQKNTRLAVKNISAYSFVQILPHAVNLFMLPVYTRYLTPSDYGKLSLIQAMVTFIATFIALQFTGPVARFYFDYKGRRLREYISTNIFSIIGISGIVFGIIHLLGDRIVILVYPNAGLTYSPYFKIALTTLFITQINVFINNLLVTMQKGTLILFRTILFTGLGLILTIYLVVFQNAGILGILYSALITNVLLLVVNYFLIDEYVIFVFRLDDFTRNIKYALPLVPHAMSAFLFSMSDRIILEKHTTLALIGVYSVAEKVAFLAKYFVNAIGRALQPQYNSIAIVDIKSANIFTNNVISLFMTFISLVIIIVSILSLEIIELFTTQEYLFAAMLIPILITSYVFRGLYIFVSYNIFFLKKTLYMPIITLSAGIFNVALNIMIIPTYDILGAAIVRVLSFALMFCMVYIVTKRMGDVEIIWKPIINNMTLLGLFLFSFYSYHIYDWDMSAKLTLIVVLVTAIFAINNKTVAKLSKLLPRRFK